MNKQRLEGAIALLRRQHYPEVSDFLEEELEERE